MCPVDVARVENFACIMLMPHLDASMKKTISAVVQNQSFSNVTYLCVCYQEKLPLYFFMNVVDIAAVQPEDGILE